MEGTAAGDGSEAGDSSGGSACEPLPEVPPEAEFTWCTADPYSLPPLPSKYVACVDGFVEFRHSTASDGYLFYDGYAQFYSVVEEASASVYGAVLDPYDGSLDDCALYDAGSSGDFGELLFEDAGDVTFTFGELQLAGDRSPDAIIIAYSASAAEEGFAPHFLAPHGFTATGATEPPIDLAAAVTLPDPIVLTAPPTDGAAVVDLDAFTLEWEPSALDMPLDLTVLVAPEGELELALFCRMNDDGEFTVPPALACHLPPTKNATLILNRADTRLITTDDGRNIVVAAETSIRPSVTLQ
jgi:hypothetical protein